MPANMTETENAILQALRELEAAVKSVPGAGAKPDLLPLLKRLDQLTGELPPGAPPELLHYLHKKSYEKARLWLENRRTEIARGGCLGD
jgi:hypothetical protein